MIKFPILLCSLLCLLPYISGHPVALRDYFTNFYQFETPPASIIQSQERNPEEQISFPVVDEARGRDDMDDMQGIHDLIREMLRICSNIVNYTGVSTKGAKIPITFRETPTSRDSDEDITLPEKDKINVFSTVPIVKALRKKIENRRNAILDKFYSKKTLVSSTTTSTTPSTSTHKPDLPVILGVDKSGIKSYLDKGVRFQSLLINTSDRIKCPRGHRKDRMGRCKKQFRG